jgi:hypothetical protein
MTALVSGSASKAARQSMKLVPGHRVAADAHAGGLADALLAQLVQRLVGQGARAAHDAHRATGQGDVARGDADVALPGLR